MDTDPSPRKRGQRSWTDAQRTAQARNIRTHKVWQKATGPKTELGKSISSRNSYKHGRYSFDKQVLRWYIRLAALRVKQVRAAIIDHEQKYRNELINRFGDYSVKKPDTMAFYPYFELSPLDPAYWKRKKRKIDPVMKAINETA